MMARGFKPVGWVAAVAGAALGCYMLSLNVASERADLEKIEHQIISTKQDIRSLQTELGTRGRMAQLETWNAEVLALSAPATGQFLDDELKLARFDQPAPTLDDRANLRLASAETGPSEVPAIAAPVVETSAPAPAPAHIQPVLPGGAMVRQASLEVAAPKPQPISVQPVRTETRPAARAPRAETARIDSKLSKEITAAAALEAGPGGR
jgi:hypothetical protein